MTPLLNEPAGRLRELHRRGSPCSCPTHGTCGARGRWPPRAWARSGPPAQESRNRWAIGTARRCSPRSRSALSPAPRRRSRFRHRRPAGGIRPRPGAVRGSPLEAGAVGSTWKTPTMAPAPGSRSSHRRSGSLLSSRRRRAAGSGSRSTPGRPLPRRFPLAAASAGGDQSRTRASGGGRRLCRPDPGGGAGAPGTLVRERGVIDAISFPGGPSIARLRELGVARISSVPSWRGKRRGSSSAPARSPGSLSSLRGNRNFATASTSAARVGRAGHPGALAFRGPQRLSRYDRPP